MNYAVLKASSYALVHTPDMILHNGTTQTVEARNNPDSDYLKNITQSYRSFEEVVAYPPNQTYIGNMTPQELRALGKSWVGMTAEGADKNGKLGEIMPQLQFYALMKVADVFDLLFFGESFLSDILSAYREHPFATEEEFAKIQKASCSDDELTRLVAAEGAEGLYNAGVLVGCVKRAHDVDDNLSAHVLFENLVVKASGILAARNIFAKHEIDPASIDYVLECSEEACGDMNQRGGGNFAKSIAEMCGAVNATGSDVRGFCAAPTHSLISAASLVAAGTYKNVLIVAGGASAKLGMNGKDHVKKELPILEDVLGAFALVIAENDGVNPVIRHDCVGRHTVGTGSSPQAVIGSLVTQPLEEAGLKITDVDKFSAEMQNPDITKPAGAGDVPEANFKMIAAMGVKSGQLERTQVAEFVEKHGMCGWAPTQGHIPSGVPYLGFAQQDLTSGAMNRAMIVGKGSLFLGRMTNLFDGVSVLLERNSGTTESVSTVSREDVKKLLAESIREYASSLLAE
ncbi:MAG: ketoacyl-ACP synthase III family protein [Desulfovibrionales bacterium]|nr:ketoacyl-ACP synthase III family protein [Desulfovibrionales bacterium]